MRNKIALAAAAILVMVLGVAAVAYSRASVASHVAASCCVGDKCPMKNKDAAAGDAKAHENCCCKDGADACPMKKGEPSAVSIKSDHGDSCPMMTKGEAGPAVHVEMKHDAASGDHKGCCCPCCTKEKTQPPAV